MKHSIVACLIILFLCFSLNIFVSCGNDTRTKSDVKIPPKTETTSQSKSAVNGKKQNQKDEKAQGKQISSSNEKSEYKVVFKDENGKTISKQTVKEGTSAQKPKTPKKKGYYFYSWSRDVDNITGDVIVTPVFLKEGTMPQVEAGKAIANATKENVAVDVMVKNNPGISSLAIDVVYDKKHLKLRNFNYNKDALKGSATVPFNDKVDPICLSMINSTENITGDFKFATLYFDVLDNSKGSYPIILTCDDENVYNIDEVNVHFELINGLITVK